MTRSAKRVCEILYVFDHPLCDIWAWYQPEIWLPYILNMVLFLRKIRVSTLWVVINQSWKLRKTIRQFFLQIQTQIRTTWILLVQIKFILKEVHHLCVYIHALCYRWMPYKILWCVLYHRLWWCFIGSKNFHVIYLIFSVTWQQMTMLQFASK